MRNTIEIRLGIIRSVRASKFEILDYNINLMNDAGLDTSELRAHRQRLRDVTNPYKELLLQEEITPDEDSPMASLGWDAFTSVDWN